MTNITSTGLEQLGSNAVAATPKKQLGQADFLRLLVAQINNQNPLEPQSNSEFVAQMAQFGTVDGVSKLNDSFSKLSSMMQSNQVLQASMLVGRKVLLPSDQAYFDGENVSGSVSLTQPVSQVKISYMDSKGQLLHVQNLGDQPGKELNFNWNGVKDNGEKIPLGNVKVTVTAIENGTAKSFATHSAVKVDGVSFDEAKGIKVTVKDLGEYDLNQINKIQ